MPKRPIYAVIMAGGSGTRFWPWSRQELPKQLLPIVSHRTMVRETVDRLRKLAPPERIFVVTNRSQVVPMRREIPRIPEKNFLAEPVGRNTAPCLCLASIAVQRLDPEASMIVLPADHSISPEEIFLEDLRNAAAFAARGDFLMTLGIHPTRPETGYGYIQKGEVLARVGQTNIFKARAFREKPAVEKAKAYLRQGKYLWNSGIFVWKVGVFWRAVRDHLPDLYGEMRLLNEAWGTPRAKRALEQVYGNCRNVSVDYGIMEKAKNVGVVEARFRWSDVGSWSALWEIRPKDRDGNAQIGKRPGRGKVLSIDSSGCLIRGEEKLITLIGMKDTVVIESGNALLICPRNRSQEVRLVLEELKKKGWKEYL